MEGEKTLKIEGAQICAQLFLGGWVLASSHDLFSFYDLLIDTWIILVLFK